jgi:hypothetical protein
MLLMQMWNWKYWPYFYPLYFHKICLGSSGNNSEIQIMLEGEKFYWLYAILGKWKKGSIFGSSAYLLVYLDQKKLSDIWRSKPIYSLYYSKDSRPHKLWSERSYHTSQSLYFDPIKKEFDYCMVRWCGLGGWLKPWFMRHYKEPKHDSLQMVVKLWHWF